MAFNRGSFIRDLWADPQAKAIVVKYDPRFENPEFANKYMDQTFWTLQTLWANRFIKPATLDAMEAELKTL
jgi:hypothetical protein